MLRHALYLCPVLAISILFSGCYTLKNASIPADLNYFYVNDFRITAPNAPPTIDTDFEEALKNKIRRESKLALDRNLAQVTYSGAVVGYNVQVLAPEPNATVGLNRLNISVKVKFENLEDPEKNWEETFRDYAEFPPDQLLSDIEPELIRTLFDRLTENVFNESFGDW